MELYTYRIFKVATHNSRASRVGDIMAPSGEDALREFASHLSDKHTAKEFRPDAGPRFPAFLVTRLWDGTRTYHYVRWEAVRVD